MDLREIEWGDMAQDRDQWRALVETTMKLRIPYSFGISEQLSD
jgi:hypothetical protein